MQPDEGDAYRRRAFLLQEGADSAGAIDDYSHAIALNPQDAEALRGRGYARLSRHEADPAIEDPTAR